MEHLKTFEKLSKQIEATLKSGRTVELRPGTGTLEAFIEAHTIVEREIRRRQNTGPKRSDKVTNPGTAKMRQFRDTGSTKGWRALLTDE